MRSESRAAKTGSRVLPVPRDHGYTSPANRADRDDVIGLADHADVLAGVVARRRIEPQYARAALHRLDHGPAKGQVHCAAACRQLNGALPRVWAARSRRHHAPGHLPRTRRPHATNRAKGDQDRGRRARRDAAGWPEGPVDIIPSASLDRTPPAGSTSGTEQVVDDPGALLPSYSVARKARPSADHGGKRSRRRTRPRSTRSKPKFACRHDACDAMKEGLVCVATAPLPARVWTRSIAATRSSSRARSKGGRAARSSCPTRRGRSSRRSRVAGPRHTAGVHRPLLSRSGRSSCALTTGGAPLGRRQRRRRGRVG